MIKHAAFTISRFVRDGSGHIAYFKTFGTECNGVLHEPGEVVLGHRIAEQGKKYLARAFRLRW